mgnify:CR=1 FL=1
MKRRTTRSQRYQRVFWIISLLVVLSMAISLLVSFTPRSPRITPTPTWTPIPIPAPGG